MSKSVKINKNLLLIGAAVILGVLLILLGGKGLTDDKDDGYPASNDEIRVQRFVESIDGAGKVSVIVTRAEGASGGYTSGGDGEAGIRGIAVSASGAADPKVRQKIILLLSSAFDIPTNKIYVSS